MKDLHNAEVMFFYGIVANQHVSKHAYTGQTASFLLLVDLRINENLSNRIMYTNTIYNT